MKVQIYVIVHLLLMICTPVIRTAAIASPYTEPYIKKHMHVKQYYCGENVRTLLGAVCETYNEPSRKKRAVTEECCRSPCTITHLIRYYCNTTKFDITSPSSLLDARRKNFYSESQEDQQSSAERVNQSGDNNYSGQVRKNAISRSKIKGRWGKYVAVAGNASSTGKRKGKCWCTCLRRRIRARKYAKAVAHAKNEIRKQFADANSDAGSRPAPVYGVIEDDTESPIMGPLQKERRFVSF